MKVQLFQEALRYRIKEVRQIHNLTEMGQYHLSGLASEASVNGFARMIWDHTD